MPVQISPRTLKPETEQKKFDEGFEKARLEDQAAHRMITESPDGTRVIRIVTDKLIQRVEKVFNEDPECGALLSVLKELGATERIGKLAVDQLVRKYLYGSKQGG